MIKIKVRILKIFAQVGNTLFDFTIFSILLISKDHFTIITINIVGKVKLFILIKHLKEYFIILNTLVFIGHHHGDFLLKSFQHWHNLFDKWLEFAALLFHFIFFNQIESVFIDWSSFSNFSNNLNTWLFYHRF